MSKQSEVATAAAKHADKALKNERMDKASKEAVVKKITDKKDLTYLYPEDCTDLPSRKKFRSKTRKAVERLRKQYKAAKAGKLENVTEEQARKELNKFLKSVHTEPELVAE